MTVSRLGRTPAPGGLSLRPYPEELDSSRDKNRVANSEGQPISATVSETEFRAGAKNGGHSPTSQAISRRTATQRGEAIAQHVLGVATRPRRHALMAAAAV